MSRIDWIYVLDRDFDFVSSLAFAQETDCFDRKGTRRLTVFPHGLIRVYADYAWDGCTPKWNVWDIALGVPDGVPNHITKKPKAYRASLLHDVLYQFLEVGLPLQGGGKLDRKAVDDLFLHVLMVDDFRPGPLYYRFVRIFGGMFLGARKRLRNYAGSKRPALKGPAS